MNNSEFPSLEFRQSVVDKRRNTLQRIIDKGKREMDCAENGMMLSFEYKQAFLDVNQERLAGTITEDEAHKAVLELQMYCINQKERYYDQQTY